MKFSSLRILFAVFCFVAVPALALRAAEYELRDLDGGDAEIAKYNGNATLAVVPAKLDGKRIVGVGDWAFSGNATLTSVVLPMSLRTIGAGAFANCTALQSVNFSAALEKIKDRAFFGCSSLAEVELSYNFGLKEIGQEAFALCRALKNENVRLPANGVRTGRNAFPSDVKPAVAELPAVVVEPEPETPKLENVDVPPRNPKAKAKGKEKHVLIIANEKYEKMSEVAYAARDGEIFRKYCIETLGIDAKNIKVRKNALAFDMMQEVKMLVRKGERAKRANKDVEFIVYYAGHGVPESSRSEKSCLLPSDGSATEPNPYFELGSLYKKLGESGAKHVCFFIDACFSGATRDGKADGRLARPAPRVEPEAIPPNVAVFAAAKLNQTAWGIPDQKHGVFTYALLKNLKEKNGDISYEELRKALMWDVPDTAESVRRVQQDASVDFGDEFPKDKKLTD